MIAFHSVLGTRRGMRLVGLPKGRYQIENKTGLGGEYRLCKTQFAIISFVITVLFLFSVTSPTSLATEEEDDCFDIGYRDGLDRPFDHEKYEECKAAASSYYHGFINGCMSVEGNTREICESATD